MKANLTAFGMPILTGLLLVGLWMNAPDSGTECTTADYAHIPYAESFDFRCTEDTMTVYNAETSDVIATEARCKTNEVKAEDGTCVPEDFYE